MLGENIDWYGIAAVIAALTGLVTAIFSALAHKPIKDTKAAVTTMNGQTLAQLAEADESRRVNLPSEPPQTG